MSQGHVLMHNMKADAATAKKKNNHLWKQQAHTVQEDGAWLTGVYPNSQGNTELLNPSHCS